MRLLPLLLGSLLLLRCGGGGDALAPTPTPTNPAATRATLMSRVPRTGVAGCWGYTAQSGARYGLRSTARGILVGDPRDPAQPRVLEEVAGPTNTPSPCVYWREMRTYGHYAYIVSEQTDVRGGIMILDLAGLPASVRFVKAVTPQDGRLNAHTLDIDPDRGLLFLQRYSSNPAPTAAAYDPEDSLGRYSPTDGSVDIYSLASPEDPSYLTTFNQSVYVHDMTARNGYCYVAEGTHSSYSMWDVRDPMHPSLVLRWEVEPGHFAHNIWPSPDGTHVVTTEEIPNGLPARIWRLNGSAAPIQVAQFKQGTGTPHNAIWQGDRIFFSHYSEGVVVVDVSNRQTPVMAARYDTSPMGGPDLNGCWGVYPFPDGKMVIGSDILQGFHLVRVDAP